MPKILFLMFASLVLCTSQAMADGPGKGKAIPVFADDGRARELGARLVRDSGFVPVIFSLARARDGLPNGPLSGIWNEADLKRKQTN
jgi:hypothetical protein